MHVKKIINIKFNNLIFKIQNSKFKKKKKKFEEFYANCHPSVLAHFIGVVHQLD